MNVQFKGGSFVRGNGWEVLVSEEVEPVTEEVGL